MICILQVQELVAMGSALDYILDYPNAVNQTDFKLWAAQIASGMTYLEEKGLKLLIYILSKNKCS